MTDILSKKENELKVLIEWFEKNLERINIDLIEGERCEFGKRVFLLSKNCGQMSFTISREHLGGRAVGNSYHNFYLYDILAINNQKSAGRYEASVLQEILYNFFEKITKRYRELKDFNKELEDTINQFLLDE
jgi:hypothetical protein